MIRLGFGLAALAGSLFLFELWLSQREMQKGVERLERYEIPHAR
jgi:hypothetical protein